MAEIDRGAPGAKPPLPQTWQASQTSNLLGLIPHELSICFSLKSTSKFDKFIGTKYYSCQSNHF